MTATLAEPITGRNWLDHAACRGLPPAMFEMDRNDTRAQLEALAVCRRCPVQRYCYAVTSAQAPRDRNWGQVAGGHYFG